MQYDKALKYIYSRELFGIKLGLTASRKIVLDYMRGRGFHRILKTKVIEIANAEDLKDFANQLRKGPSDRYRIWLESKPEVTRKMTLENLQKPITLFSSKKRDFKNDPKTVFNMQSS